MKAVRAYRNTSTATMPATKVAVPLRSSFSFFIHPSASRSRSIERGQRVEVPGRTSLLAPGMVPPKKAPCVCCSDLSAPIYYVARGNHQ